MPKAGQVIEGPDGFRLDLIRTGDETGGALLVMEAHYSGDSPMPPAHLHPGQDERFTILEGSVLMTIDGEEFLFYRAFPVDVALIRATTADPDGNLTMEREALTLESLAIAMAARNSGGIVIAQVERLAEAHSLPARQVKAETVSDARADETRGGFLCEARSRAHGHGARFLRRVV